MANYPKKVHPKYIRRRRAFLAIVILLIVSIVTLVVILSSNKKEKDPENSSSAIDNSSGNSRGSSKEESSPNSDNQLEDSSSEALADDSELDDTSEEDNKEPDSLGVNPEDEVNFERLSTEGDTSPNSVPSVKPKETTKKVVDWRLILVNSKNKLPKDFTIETSMVSNYEVDKRIEKALITMMMDAKAAGINLELISGYRSVEKQQKVYDDKIAEYLSMGYGQKKAVQYTEMYIAIPRESEHHTGLAVDLVTPSYRELTPGYANTAAAKWLKENAADYGFILRYPKDKEKLTGISFEPWHYRYVGISTAKTIMSKGYCLEEYLFIQEKAEKDKLAKAEEKETESSIESTKE